MDQIPSAGHSTQEFPLEGGIWGGGDDTALLNTGKQTAVLAMCWHITDSASIHGLEDDELCSLRHPSHRVETVETCLKCNKFKLIR